MVQKRFCLIVGIEEYLLAFLAYGNEVNKIVAGVSSLRIIGHSSKVFMELEPEEC